MSPFPAPLSLNLRDRARENKFPRAAPLRWMAGFDEETVITLQNPPQIPAVLLPERFRAETCAFGALIKEGLSDRVWSIGERVA